MGTPETLYNPALIDARVAVTADVVLAVTPSLGLVLLGFSCRESASSAAVATFRIIHGATVAEGSMVFPIELNANQSTSEWLGPDGIETPRGLTIDIIAGEVDITLFYRRKTVAYKLDN